MPLLPIHWRELTVFPEIPLNPDYEFYRRAEAAGLLKIYTARESGELIGYAIFVVKKSHPHYSGHSWAVNDIVWLHPDKRSAGIGGAFGQFWESELSALGMDVIHIDAKTHVPMLIYMLKKLGYNQTGAGMTKRIRNGHSSDP